MHTELLVWACKTIGAAERDLGWLSDGQRRDLLADQAAEHNVLVYGAPLDAGYIAALVADLHDWHAQVGINGL